MLLDVTVARIVWQRELGIGGPALGCHIPACGAWLCPPTAPMSPREPGPQGRERSRRWGRRSCLHPPSLQGPEHQGESCLLEKRVAELPSLENVTKQHWQFTYTFGEGAETDWKRFHNSGLRKCTVALGWVPKSSLRLCFLLKSWNNRCPINWQSKMQREILLTENWHTAHGVIIRIFYLPGL